MANPQSPAATLRKVMGAIRRHQRKSLAFFVITMGIVGIGLAVFPRTYRSEARFYVRPWLQNVAQDPAISNVQAVAIQESREVEVNSIVEVLKSRGLAEQVVAKLGPGKILGGTAAPPDAAIPTETENRAQVKVREKAVTALLNSIHVYSPRKSTVIDIHYEADSPEAAQEILSTLIGIYLEEHARINRTEWSGDFFTQQSALLKQRLEESTAALRDAKNEVGLTSVEGQRKTLQDQLGSIETQIVTAEAEFAAVEAKVQDLERSMAELPEWLLAAETTNFPNKAATDMRGLLYTLEVREKELSSMLNDDHPRLRALREQIAESRKIVDEAAPAGADSDHVVNPPRQQLESLSLLSERAQVASLTARKQELQQQRDLVFEELRRLNSSEIRIADLQRKVDLAEANYRTYANKLEESRMFGALEAERISNVKVVQPATYVTKHVSPRLGLTLAAGFVMATLGAFLVALLADNLDRSLKTTDQIEQQLQLPVLLSVPRMTEERVLAH